MKSRRSLLIQLLIIVAVMNPLAACAWSSLGVVPLSAQPTTADPQVQKQPSRPASSGVQGKVKDGQTGKELVGVYLNFKSQDGTIIRDTLTDASGAYQVDLPAGRYKVIASLEGYQTFSSDTPLESTATGYATLAITLTPKAAVTPSTSVLTGGSGNCAGKQLGGFCWYIGDVNQSCETVCSAHGGYDEATKNYAGSGGTEYHCRDVSAKLEIPLDLSTGFVNFDTFDLPVNLGGVGCSIHVKAEGLNDLFWDKDLTTSQATTSVVQIRRMCACQK